MAGVAFMLISHYTQHRRRGKLLSQQEALSNHFGAKWTKKFLFSFSSFFPFLFSFVVLSVGFRNSVYRLGEKPVSCYTR